MEVLQKEERAAAIETTDVPHTSHDVVMPGDLIMEGGLVSRSTTDDAYAGEDVLFLLVQAHRRWNVGGEGSSFGGRWRAAMDPRATLHTIVPERHIAAVDLATA